VQQSLPSSVPDRVFVHGVTAPASVPLVPEVLLLQGGDAIEVWEQAEARAGGRQLAPPFWAFPWAGGQALARHVLDSPDLVTGRRVLDLAAGSGLVAVACALAGAVSVVANEVDPLAAAAIELNAELNGVLVRPLLADLLAEPVAEPVAQAPRPGTVDVVLAGDVFYDRHMAAQVWPYLRRHAAAGAVVLVGDPSRAYRPRRGLSEVARYAVPVLRTLEDRDVRDTAVLRVDPPDPLVG
jgi:predicted nicotinamide N-methyase